MTAYIQNYCTSELDDQFNDKLNEISGCCLTKENTDRRKTRFYGKQRPRDVNVLCPFLLHLTIKALFSMPH